MQPDGSVVIDERITYDFDGSFSGGWRDIPTRFGEQVDHASVSVSEDGGPYRPGGTTELGAPGPPGTFAVGPGGGGTRIVWRYRAADETRTFDISYEMRGLVRIHHDTAELDVRVWGDQWDSGLGLLQAQVVFPRAASDLDRVRVWGHPREVQGEVARANDGVSLQATGIGSEQWVELRVLFPLELLDSTTGAIDASAIPDEAYAGAGGARGFDAVVASEVAQDERFAEEERRRAEQVARIRSNLWWLGPGALLAVFGPAIVIFWYVGRRFGRDPQPDVPVDYVREPPSEDSPGVVGALIREGGAVGSQEFLATFFDLIRRGYFRAEHETTEKSTWMGLRSEIISDLRVRLGDDPEPLTGPDREVYDAIAPVIAADGTLASELGDELKGRAKTFYKDFTAWKSAVADALRDKGWIDRRGRRIWGGSVALLFGVAVVGFAWLMFRSGQQTLSIAGIALIVMGGVNGFVLLVLGLAAPKALTRRKAEGVDQAARWDGLRRYLEDFSTMSEAPPASVKLWESMLVYGIVLGVADRVLQAAQIAAPAELAERSDLYWIDGNGTGLGGGLTALHLHGLTSGLDRAVSAGAPRSSGGGGGFSGGGGFGGGGGGGGAW